MTKKVLPIPSKIPTAIIQTQNPKAMTTTIMKKRILAKKTVVDEDSN